MIKTERISKGDLVPGHKVYAFFDDPDLPAVPGEIVSTSASGHSVTMAVETLLSVFGLPKRTEWTWRASAGTYQQKGTRTKPECGLARVIN